MPKYKNKFIFDELAFRKYFELFMIPHQLWKDASRLSYIGLIFSTPWFFMIGVWYVCVIQDALTGSYYNDNPFYHVSFIPPTFIALLYPVCMWFCFAYGAYFSMKVRKGKHNPKWGTGEWNKRTRYAFQILKYGASRPALLGTYYTPALLWGAPFITWYSVAMHNKWYNCNYFFTNCCILPGVDFPKRNYLNDLEYQPDLQLMCDFESRFFEDHIEKGSKRKSVSFEYSEIFDIVESVRVPEFAIIRMKDQVTEIVVNKNAFEEASSWSEVREFIYSKMPKEERKKKWWNKKLLKEK